jgi:hypothetical protein
MCGSVDCFILVHTDIDDDTCGVYDINASHILVVRFLLSDKHPHLYSNQADVMASVIVFPLNTLSINTSFALQFAF